MKIPIRTPWVVLAATIGLLAPALADQAPPPPLPALDVSTSVAPTGAGRTELLARPVRTYECTFRVVEPGTRSLFVERTFTVPLGGQKAVAASNEGLQFKFSASVDREGTRVTTETSVTSAAGVGSHFSSTFWLPRASGSRDEGSR